jgi:hypothetical protein
MKHSFGDEETGLCTRLLLTYCCIMSFKLVPRDEEEEEKEKEENKR